MDASPPRRLAAEPLGTGLLIVFGPGSVVAALTLGTMDFPGLGVIGLSGGLLGALLAAVAYDLLARPRAAEPVAEPPQGTQGDIAGRRVSEREDGVGPPPGRIPQQAGDTDVRAGRRG